MFEASARQILHFKVGIVEDRQEVVERVVEGFLEGVEVGEGFSERVEGRLELDCDCVMARLTQSSLEIFCLE